MKQLKLRQKLAIATIISFNFLHVNYTFAAPPTGGWVIEDGTDMPQFTKIVITRIGNKYKGIVTSKWYGDLEMQDIQIDGNRLHFRLFNGNMRVPEYPIFVKMDGDKLHFKGRIWDREFDIHAKPASNEQLKSLDFRKETLPPRKVLKPLPLTQTPPMGWSSWNKFADKIDDKTIREIADAMVSSGLRDAGYIYVNIDDGWQGVRNSSGELQPNAHFPDMKDLADYLHSKGLKLGLYSSPGPKSCAGYEGSYGHVEQDAKTFAAWGVDYLKYDLCSGEAFYHSEDTVYRTYQKMGSALQATKRNIIYSLCQYGRFNVGEWGNKVGGHLWRTTGDIEDTYAAMSRIGFDLNGVPNYSGPNGWNDPDMLEVGNGGMSYEEYKTHMSLWAILSAPLILGNDLRSMSEETLSILKHREIIAINQDKLGIQALPIQKNNNKEIWRKKLSDNSVVFGLFNRGTEEAILDVNWATLGGKPVKIKDVWSGKDLDLTNTTSVKLPAHGSAVLKVSY